MDYEIIPWNYNVKFAYLKQSKQHVLNNSVCNKGNIFRKNVFIVSNFNLIINIFFNQTKSLNYQLHLILPYLQDHL